VIGGGEQRDRDAEGGAGERAPAAPSIGAILLHLPG